MRRIGCVQDQGNDMRAWVGEGLAYTRLAPRLKASSTRARPRQRLAPITRTVLSAICTSVPQVYVDEDRAARRVAGVTSVAGYVAERRSAVPIARRERGIWQRRYWERQIRDADELIRYVEYIHFNPVKHGHAARPNDWPHSSFRSFGTEPPPDGRARGGDAAPTTARYR